MFHSAKADSATSDAERLDLLTQIEVFWPDYRDVRSRLEALRKAQTPPDTSGASGASGASGTAPAASGG